MLHATPTTSPSKVLTRIVRRESHKASGCEQQPRWNILSVHTRHHVNLCGASTECVRVYLCEETLQCLVCKPASLSPIRPSDGHGWQEVPPRSAGARLVMTPGAHGCQTGGDVATVETDLADLPHAWQVSFVGDPRLHVLSPRLSSWLGLICAHEGPEVRMVMIAARSPSHRRQLGRPFRVSHNVDWNMAVLT